jgi:hypothetical protein
MVQEETLEDPGHEIKADRSYAQILIKIAHSSTSDVEAKKIIEGLGIHIIARTQLSPQWVLFMLDVKDMRSAALKLTERGFFIKGINALPEE